jgi:hypothetical protein
MCGSLRLHNGARPLLPPPTYISFTRHKPKDEQRTRFCYTN